MKRNAFSLFIVILLFLSLLSCRLLDDLLHLPEPVVPTPEPITPIQVTRQFIEYLNVGKPDNALDLVCDSMALPNLPEDTFRKVSYEEVSNNDVYAEVRVTAEIRLEVKLLGALKKDMDFLMTLDNVDGDWCVNNDSVANFLLSMFNFK